MITVHHGECVDVMSRLPKESFDSCVCDPPYHLQSTVKRFGKPGSAPAKFGTDGVFARSSGGFMGQQWDGGDVAFQPETWRAVYERLKPGAYLLAFGGTRTWHRMGVAIEDGGFEIRDTVMWLYGTGFPKSHEASKGIDKAVRGVPHGGADPTSPNHGKYKSGCSEENPSGRGFGAGPGSFMVEAGKRDSRDLVPEAAEWRGWGTALKPAWESIILARKPMTGTIAANVLKHGTGAMNIDGCRIHTVEKTTNHSRGAESAISKGIYGSSTAQETHQTNGQEIGRWPANVIHDGSDEVIAEFAKYGKRGAASPVLGHEPSTTGQNGIYGHYDRVPGAFHGDTGTAARFFYCAKATKKERCGSKHPTIKPISLMRYLCRLVTRPNGLILDPFAGSGSTGVAARAEGFNALLIEREAPYVRDIIHRLRMTASD